VELLRSAGADVTIRFFNAGHSLTNDEVETAGQWLTNL
jgi:predicted esterase